MEARPDRFYLGFACHGCRTPIEIVIDDASDKCKFVAEGILQILCPECGHQGHYPTKHVQRYPRKEQEQSEGGTLANHS